MENQFIPIELARQIKELNFNEPCFGGWDKDNIFTYHPDSDIILDAPLFQQAFDWFRINHNLHVSIYHWHKDFADSMGHKQWEGCVTHLTQKRIGGNDFFDTYKEAQIYSINLLIELVETKTI